MQNAQKKPLDYYTLKNSQRASIQYTSIDIVGQIAIVRIPGLSLVKTIEIAEILLRSNKRLKSVYSQASAISGNHRTRDLIYLAGEPKTLTFHREFGCIFSVNLETCFFSPRLSYERLRIAKLVTPGEIIVNMFAGVGCFSILIAKQSAFSKIYSIDINPEAIRFLEENIRLNRVFGSVIPLLGDAKGLINCKLNGVSDRVLMPLPEKALDYLPSALTALKSSGGWIHVHTFEHASKSEDPCAKSIQKVADKLISMGVSFEIPFSHEVRKIGPNWHQIVTDVKVKSVDNF